MNRVKSTLFRSSGTRKTLIRVLNIELVRCQRSVVRRRSSQLTTDDGQPTIHSDFGASASGLGASAAGAAAPSAGAPSAASFFLPPFFAPPSRGTNFFLGLGNSNASPLRFCAVPPAWVILPC